MCDLQLPKYRENIVPSVKKVWEFDEELQGRDFYEMIIESEIKHKIHKIHLCQKVDSKTYLKIMLSRCKSSYLKPIEASIPATNKQMWDIQ